ncbi:MAG: DUF86 domain-containing protein [Spirochaetaceae bacterium]
MHIEPDNIIFNKGAIIERSLRRMLEEFSSNPSLDNFTHVDAMILNIERACQAVIDLAGHIVSVKHLGIPQNSGEAFTLLSNNSIISSSVSKSMISMTGFRNIAIHEYQEINLEILKAIATKEYKSIISFCSEIGIKIVP